MRQLLIPENARRRVASRAAMLALAAALLSGCAVLGGGGSQPLDTFDLVAPMAGDSRPVRRRTQVLVAEPTADQTLDSSNIVVRTGPYAIEYLGGSQWSDRLTRLVQRRLADAFQSSDRFGGVGLPGQGLAIDYQVITNIQRFGIDATRDQAEVSIEATLVNDRNGVVLASRRIAVAVPVPATSRPDVLVSALNAAFASVAEETVIWVSARI